MNSVIYGGVGTEGGGLVAADEQPLQQVHGELFRHGSELLVGLFDVEEEIVKFGEQLIVCQLQSPHPLRHLGPLEPVGPIGPWPEIDPAVIPLPGIRRPAVIVHGRRREQQQVAGLHGEGLIPLEDLPLALDGQVDDEALHALRAVDDEVEGAPLLYGGHARDQEDVEGVARQQGIELFRLLFLHRGHGGKQRLGKKIGLGHCRDPALEQPIFASGLM
ncbi:hypothetical protein D3C80_1290420 [compost metagenome]